jgi:hypothetical protein
MALNKPAHQTILDLLAYQMALNKVANQIAPKNSTHQLMREACSCVMTDWEVSSKKTA